MIIYYDKVFSLVDVDEKTQTESSFVLAQNDFSVTKLWAKRTCLEGGYNPVKLAECMKNHLFALSHYG
jgi:hypothetical protein